MQTILVERVYAIRWEFKRQIASNSQRFDADLLDFYLIVLEIIGQIS